MLSWPYNRIRRCEHSTASVFVFPYLTFWSAFISCAEIQSVCTTNIGTLLIHSLPRKKCWTDCSVTDTISTRAILSTLIIDTSPHKYFPYMINIWKRYSCLVPIHVYFMSVASEGYFSLPNYIQNFRQAVNKKQTGWNNYRSRNFKNFN